MKRFLHTAPAALLLFAMPTLVAASGPVFDKGGPDAPAYGQADGYPKGPAASDESTEQKFLVYASSHWDEFAPTHRVPHGTAWAFHRTEKEPELRYDFGGKSLTLTDFLAHVPVTGLLIVRDDTILAEHYQYARSDRDRFVGNSMTKTLIALLLGDAIADGRIKSVDDHAAAYVKPLAGNALGDTPLRALLHMSSDVGLNEEMFYKDLYTPKEDTAVSLAHAATKLDAPGTKFRYSCGDSETLTTVLQRATGQDVARYFTEKIWKPIGAEADATWVADSSNQIVSCWGFSATLRDYGRIGRLLAWDGAWNGKQLLPRAWMLDATTVRTEDKQVAPGTAAHYYGYGYQLWILPGERRMFALIGAQGQYVFVDPTSKLVLVQTAVRRDTQVVTSPHNETLALWLALVKQFG
jgi:CubicO group peptidase (beta-lactamase class C family)